MPSRRSQEMKTTSAMQETSGLCHKGQGDRFHKEMRLCEKLDWTDVLNIIYIQE